MEEVKRETIILPSEHYVNTLEHDVNIYTKDAIYVCPVVKELRGGHEIRIRCTVKDLAPMETVQKFPVHRAPSYELDVDQLRNVLHFGGRPCAMFFVSTIVGQAIKESHRNLCLEQKCNIVVPGTPVRDEKGAIIGCESVFCYVLGCGTI